MGDTLKKSLNSIFDQIGTQFEVILVDDGSSDNSILVCQEFEKKYNNFRLISLERDSNRLLGETRNFSISAAEATWCIFHLDTDDFIGPHIIDFVELVVALSSKMSHDVLFSGQQIHMAKKDFLLSKGPFSNIYRGEDRDLYFRLVKNSEWIIILHKRFIYRLSRNRRKLLIKSVRDLYDQSVTDLRTRKFPFSYLLETLNLSKTLGIKVVLFRFLTIFWAWKSAQKRGFLNKKNYPSHIEFVTYRSANTKTSQEWLEQFGIAKSIRIDHNIFY